jgi:hypothetical protein
MGALAAALNEIYDFNPLAFDYVLKRTLRARDADGREHRFSPAIFEQHPALAPTRKDPHLPWSRESG